MSQTATRTDRLKAAHSKLQQAVAEIVSGEDWKRMLQVASKFHRYSFHNQQLIFLQRPDATLVAGFHKWKSMGRFVKKGEKGIAIFAPCKYKVDPSSDGPAAASSDGKGKGKDGADLDSGSSISAVEVAASSAASAQRSRRAQARQRGDRPKTELRGFRVVYVFDISQTEGEELPDLDAVRPKLLDGDAPEGIWDALVAQAQSAGYKVVRQQRGSANGYCDFLNKEIGVRPDVSTAQAVKTLIHELAHALLHSEGVQPNRDVAEVEVESVAFVVLDALGLASDDYSFPYVARWSDGNADVIKETGERAVACASQILAGLRPTSDRVLPDDTRRDIIAT